jgi:hypothetical protein
VEAATAKDLGLPLSAPHGSGGRVSASDAVGHTGSQEDTGQVRCRPLSVYGIGRCGGAAFASALKLDTHFTAHFGQLHRRIDDVAEKEPKTQSRKNRRLSLH